VKNTFILLLAVFTISIFSSTSWAEYGVVVQGGLCGSGGTSGGNSESDYDNDSGSDVSTSSDLSISNLYITIKGEDNWHNKIKKTLKPGQAFRIEGKTKIKNKSDVEAEDVRVKFRIDGTKNFNTNDVVIDKKSKEDIDPDDHITKKLKRTIIQLSSNGQTITIFGPDGKKTFNVVDDFCKFYIFVTVKNKDDEDISSTFSGNDEYAVIKIAVDRYPQPDANNIASETLRFYNNNYDAHFYSVNHEDEIDLPQRHPDWLYQGPSFIAFNEQQDGTVPLYTCWTGTTHDWTRGDQWQFMSDFSVVAGCTETPWIVFYVYPNDGEHRKPVYLMRKDKANYEYSFILSNGLSDAYSLRDNYGFIFTSGNPMFWVPESLDAAKSAYGIEVSPLFIDTDGDGIYDQNELGDTDNDGIPNFQESYYTDTDNDGISDQFDAENDNPNSEEAQVPNPVQGFQLGVF